MAIGDRILDIFGQGGNRKFYMRDFKNAERFKPGVDPVRLNFQGYVNFVLNRDLFSSIYGTADGEDNFRTTISSLVYQATMPGVQFNTETINQYNRKKIVNTGVTYDPVQLQVYDTVGNEWLVLLMKYFAYHYMNPRNANSNGNRDVYGDVNRFGGVETLESFFGPEGKWDSNSAGYNTNQTANFFERIDYVLYHGNRGVQYSLINPVLNSFKASDISYASSEVKNFALDFSYEKFTIYDVTNFALSEYDLGRFENVANISGPAFAEADLPVAMKVQKTGEGESVEGTRVVDGLKLTVLGDKDNPRERSGQPGLDSQVSLDRIEAATSVSSFGPEVVATGAGGGESRSFLEELIADTADNALRAALNQSSVGDAVLGTVAGAVSTRVGSAINTAIKESAPNQGQGGD